MITESGLPYTIVRATQFAEFADQITDSLVVGDEVRVPDALIQPIPADRWPPRSLAPPSPSRSTAS